MARRHGIRLLGCDVKTTNPESFAFHRRLGFVEIGSEFFGDGTAMAYLALRWDAAEFNRQVIA